MATDKTRASIASLISKPKCTDKLLARPPFRFLFDVIVAIDAATDLRLDQVLSSHEFDSANLSDKASKLAFLTKVVKRVETRLDRSIDLNPRKVVAGLETEKTRAFLELLAAAATTATNDGVKCDPPPIAKDAFFGGDDEVKPVADTTVWQNRPLLEDIIAETRASITALISKPKCTDKLLARPPFRFLFDIIVAVNAATGFGLDDVLAANDHDFSNAIVDKASKLAFLAKVVKCIEGKLNTSIDLNPRKVVAGLEPEKTCAFLQLLVAASKISSDGKAATGDDDGRSKGTDDEVLPTDDGSDKKDGDVPDTLDLTSQSQFLPVANDSTLEDKQHTCSRVDSATDADEAAINSGENGEAEEPTSIEIADDESNGAIDIGDNGEEIPEAERMEDAVPNTLIDDAPSARDDPGSILLIAEKETTSWPLKARPGPPIEDDDTSHFDAVMNTESVGGGGASDIINNADSAPVTLQATIEAVISVTSGLGRCFDAINIDVINEERAHWSNQITVETRKLEEFRRQQDATVLAPLMQRIDAVDAKIVEKEKEIEASLQRIGDDEVEEN